MLQFGHFCIRQTRQVVDFIEREIQQLQIGALSEIAQVSDASATQIQHIDAFEVEIVRLVFQKLGRQFHL
jgi:hypothetical protein